jgi:hypothetical protein
MSIIGLSMAVLPCCAEEDVEAGSAALRVDWPVYPRRAQHNTVAEGGNRGWAEAARLPAKLSGACALHPASSGGYEPENGVAIRLPQPTHRAEPVDPDLLKPDTDTAKRSKTIGHSAMGQEPRARSLDREPRSSDFIRASGPRPRQKAGHMTEGCQPFTAEIKRLPRGRPLMTH